MMSGAPFDRTFVGTIEHCSFVLSLLKLVLVTIPDTVTVGTAEAPIRNVRDAWTGCWYCARKVAFNDLAGALAATNASVS